MKVLLFVMLAGYAVRCDENNYYVIEMVDDPPLRKPFKVFWNVPTKQCKSKKVLFQNLYEKFGIIQNENDHFRGQKITILYDPGQFPALLKNESSGRFKFRNGGVPQEGDLDKHLEAFTKELDQSIPDRNFGGVGIIDFESWRPVYRQNFGVLRPYKDVSYEIERKLHWWWKKPWLEAEAKRRFEESAHTFMQATIALAKKLRPLAKWGYYGFPYCFNMASNNMAESCASHVAEENDGISWLWQESTALFPSVYSSVELSTSQLTSLIRGRMNEAGRFGKPVLPYFWYRYRDASFLSQVDLNAALDILYKSNASGFIIWGSSSDVNTVQKCTKLLNYIENVMGPAIAKYTKPPTKLYDDINKTEGNNDATTTNNPNINRIKDIDNEYHWIPPANYTQDIKDHVEEEIKKKVSNNSAIDGAVVGNVLIDLILNSVLYGANNSNVNSTSVVETSSTTEVNIVTSRIEANKDVEVLSDTENVSTTVNTELSLQTEDSIFETSTTYDINNATIDDIPTVSSNSMITDSSRSKSEKKTFHQESEKELFYITTETPTDFKDTSELTLSTTEGIENSNKFNELTTENNISNRSDDSIQTEDNNTETNTQSIIEMATTELTDATETPSQTTITDNNDKHNIENIYTSTKEPFDVSNVTDDKSTKTPELIEYNKTTDYFSTEAPFLSENTKTVNNLSTDVQNLEETNENKLRTKTPNFKLSTADGNLSTDKYDLSTDKDHLSTDIYDLSTDRDDLCTDKYDLSTDRDDLSTDKDDLSTDKENLSTKEETSLTPTATTPVQVVVFA